MRHLDRSGVKAGTAAMGQLQNLEEAQLRVTHCCRSLKLPCLSDGSRRDASLAKR